MKHNMRLPPITPAIALNEDYILDVKINELIDYVNSCIEKRTFNGFIQMGATTNANKYFIVDISKFYSYKEAIKQVVESYKKVGWDCLLGDPAYSIYIRTDLFNPDTINKTSVK